MSDKNKQSKNTIVKEKDDKRKENNKETKIKSIDDKNIDNKEFDRLYLSKLKRDKRKKELLEKFKKDEKNKKTIKENKKKMDKSRDFILFSYKTNKSGNTIFLLNDQEDGNMSINVNDFVYLDIDAIQNESFKKSLSVFSNKIVYGIILKKNKNSLECNFFDLNGNNFINRKININQVKLLQKVNIYSINNYNNKILKKKLKPMDNQFVKKGGKITKMNDIIGQIKKDILSIILKDSSVKQIKNDKMKQLSDVLKINKKFTPFKMEEQYSSKYNIKSMDKLINVDENQIFKIDSKLEYNSNNSGNIQYKTIRYSNGIKFHMVIFNLQLLSFTKKDMDHYKKNKRLSNRILLKNTHKRIKGNCYDKFGKFKANFGLSGGNKTKKKRRSKRHKKSI